MRISPSEVHIQDPDFYDDLYKKPYEKPEKLKYRFSNPEATFQTPEFQLHKIRRAALNPFFSQKKIAEYSPAIQKRLDRLSERLDEEYEGEDRVLNLNDMWGCLTTDTIIAYCFEREYHFIEEPDFKSEFAQAISDLMDGVHVVSQFTWLPSFFQTLPDSTVVAMNPTMKTVLKFNNVSHLRAAYCKHNVDGSLVANETSSRRSRKQQRLLTGQNARYGIQRSTALQSPAQRD